MYIMLVSSEIFTGNISPHKIIEAIAKKFNCKYAQMALRLLDEIIFDFKYLIRWCKGRPEVPV
jgi:hypothetical protein